LKFSRDGPASIIERFVMRDTLRSQVWDYFCKERIRVKEASMAGLEIIVGLICLALCFTAVQFAWFVAAAQA
jgi:hypothetical protein